VSRDQDVAPKVNTKCIWLLGAK